jgi:outer membrane protein OmpA-like peptidoglycan-associated protein
MTRHGLVFSAAILSVIAVPQGARSQSVEDGIRIAQAEQQQPERRPDERRPERPGQRQQGTPGAETPAQTPAAPGQQRPPTANAPARPGAPTTAQPTTPQRPAPPATAQTPPGQQPPGAPTTAQPTVPQRPAPPATAQTPPNQLLPGAPPAAAQTPPNQRPPAPAAVQTQPTQPQRQGGPAAPVPGTPGVPGAPAAQQNVAPPVGRPAAPVQAPAAQAPAQPARPVIGQPVAPVPQAPAAPAVQAPAQPTRPVIGQPVAPVPQAPAAPAAQVPAQPTRPVIGQPAAPVPQAPAAPAAQVPAQPPRPAASVVAPAPAAVNPAQANAPVDPRTMPQHLDQLRSARHETQEGNRTVIQEADRVIIREGGQDIIRHNEADRFRFNAREVNVERRGNDTVTVVLRPDGSRIVTETDETGRLLRRVRREPDGREVIIIDNSFEPHGPGALAFVVNLPAPVVRIPREVYIRETARATSEDIFFTLTAPPVERIERRYALDEIRFSQPLRERMPRVDIDTVNFETGSWEITPDQVQRLAFVADGIRRSVQRNPREVFLVEGYTDATGNDVDNLSLSDRRAESVAVAMTNQFGVPAENLSTQGYGKQFLKIPTEGPERANRRVAVRRITPLLLGQN